MEFFSSIYLDRYLTAVLGINLFIAVMLMASLRLIAGIIANVNATEELAKRDNPAFGISLAGVALGLAVMLTGVTAGSPSGSLGKEALVVLGYGLLGIALMALSRFIFDSVALPKISIASEILKRNLAAGTVDAGNVVATAIVIRAVMLWVDSSSMQGMTMVLATYAVTQLLLTLATMVLTTVYRYTRKSTMQEAFISGNVARAVSFSGYRIGAAFAITAASGLVPYQEGLLPMMLAKWSLLSLLLMVAMALLAVIAKKIIFLRIDIRDEIDNQHNLAIGAVEAVVYVAVGLVLTSVLAI